jgi:hypothetical protein
MRNSNITFEEILASKYYNYYEDNDYILYDVREFYYPYFKVVCNCIFREKNKISLIEEMFLKAIECGIKEYQELEIFLGIDKDVFEEIAGKLHLDNLFIEKPNLILTAQGKKIVDDGEKLNTIEDEISLFLDGVTGDTLKKLDKYYNKKNSIDIRVQIPYPKNETLNKTIKNKALQTILFDAISKDDSKEKTLYEIKDIDDDKSTKIYKKYFVLFFKNSDNPKKVLIVSDGQPDDNMTNLINKIEINGKVLFDFSQNTEKEHKELEKDISIYEYTEVYSLENGTQISTYDHPKFFDYALKYAKKEIVIISPWIRWIVMEDKTQYIEKALKRGVKISFFYGMGNPRKDIDKDSKIFFKKIKREYPKLFNYSTTNQHDHSKIIICDREWMITTSFNWTSFKGDKNMGDRRGERGSFINNRNEIDKILKDYIEE